MIKAVTFDFWDTLVVDDSDEPKRAAAGLQPKPAARTTAFVDEIRAHHAHITTEQAAAAFDGANAWAKTRWKSDFVNPSVAQRVAEGFRLLRIAPTPGFSRLVEHLETMEVIHPPALLPGAAAALETLAGRYKVGIISDTIVTPGRGLMAILKGYGVLEHFTRAGLTFSDEVGRSKPAPDIFQAACSGLGCAPHEVVHVGDRERNDVTGPHDFGMKSVLFIGSVDRGSASSRADAVCSRLLDLVTILEAL